VTTRQAFGEELRREREQRGITLQHISELTKISVALLTALERGDCSRWPPGIYSRAYIRDYAQAVGLDREDTAVRFSECFTETAFPDGTPQGKSDGKDGAPEARAVVAPLAEPLRLTFVENSREHLRGMARRTANAMLDVVLSIIIAAVLSVAFDAGFWMTMALVSVCCHGLGIVRGRAHVADVLAHATARRHTAHAEPATRKAALAEAA
jgi:transcriptional regulator with XRE-family HTH domain